ncbi:3-phosphoshikimate 1-carboxyvinyltransferase, putative [Babesia ovata]|uniref:3-phosphoshikimate 1-carboxyvinyltransferase, putative n=1 Tax=Babesia ovata TaxID=189622 RepID=A0A2H6K997_9APIC|nr:3-phosphoshikimate 1-carboxyvinyltransferase, putative [Babesia ovata]GBE59582.1 3-phosphoshikimate 1-carboxyvinyltransferase, putative [Babesia ovata]
MMRVTADQGPNKASQAAVTDRVTSNVRCRDKASLTSNPGCELPLFGVPRHAGPTARPWPARSRPVSRRRRPPGPVRLPSAATIQIRRQDLCNTYNNRLRQPGEASIRSRSYFVVNIREYPANYGESLRARNAERAQGKSIAVGASVLLLDGCRCLFRRLVSPSIRKSM